MSELYNEHGIYGIINKLNGNIYVGKTENNFGDRRDCHFAALRGGYGVNPYLQKAWDKYGEDNFDFIIMLKCDDSYTTDDINALEIILIDYYKSIGKSYNIADGGDGGQLLGKHLTEEAKRKIGEKNRIHMTGRKATEETKMKMSKSQTERFANMSEDERAAFGKMMSIAASGYKWSDESKKRFSDLQKIKPNGAKYDVDTVREIRRLHEECGLNNREIANKLGMEQHTVYLITTYRRWANV